MKFISVPVDGGKAHISIDAIMVVWDFDHTRVINGGSLIQLVADGESIETPISARDVLALIGECQS